MKIKAAHPLLDTLIAENKDIRNDADLRRALGIEPATLSKIRHGKAAISDTTRILIMRRFRWTLRRLDDIAPPGSPTCGAPAGAEGE